MKMTTSLMLRAMIVCLGIFGVISSANAQQCPGIPKLKIDYHTLDFTEHKPVCVRRNGVFHIKLKALGDYELAHGKVTVQQKEGTDEISKINVVGNDIMRVRVGNFTVGTEPEYWINVSDVGTLDPRVRIIPSYVAFAPNQEVAEDYMLEEYGLSISGLQELDGYLRETFQISVVDMLEAHRSDGTETD